MTDDQHPAPRRLASLGTTQLLNASLVLSTLVVIGSLGPWARVFGLSLSGIDGDGILTLVLAVVAAAATLAVRSNPQAPRFRAHRIAVAASILALLIAAYDTIDVATTSGQLAGETIRAYPGWGLWLTLLAALTLTVVTVLLTRRVGAQQRP